MRAIDATRRFAAISLLVGARVLSANVEQLSDEMQMRVRRARARSQVFPARTRAALVIVVRLLSLIPSNSSDAACRPNCDQAHYRAPFTRLFCLLILLHAHKLASKTMYRRNPKRAYRQ